ncbi:MAG: formyltransferase family protein [Anaerolineae bacterium]|nr:formyltransferase family protein [Anaerolineae bacterium]
MNQDQSTIDDLRIAILTYESLFSNIITERILQEFPGQVVGIIRSDCLIYGRSLPQGLVYLARRAGLRFVGRKALEFFQSRLTAIVFRLIGRKAKVNSLRNTPAIYKVPVVGSTDVNSPETLAQLKAWQVNFVISNYLNQLIKPDLINLPAKGVVNVHPALLPRHRGLFPYFWVISENDKETGATVHWVDEKYDTGAILTQGRVAVEPTDTIQSLSYKCAKVAADCVVEAIRLVAAGDPPHIAQDDSLASYHSWPKPADQRRFRQQGGQYGTIFELWKYM